MSTPVKMVNQRIQMNTICRLCLGEKEQMFFIYEPTQNLQISKGKIVTVADIIMSLAPIKMFESDGLPSQVCSQCLEQADNFYLFKQKCENSDTTLRRYIGNLISDKLQTLDHLENGDGIAPAKATNSDEIRENEFLFESVPSNSLQGFQESNVVIKKEVEEETGAIFFEIKSDYDDQWDNEEVSYTSSNHEEPIIKSDEVICALKSSELESGVDVSMQDLPPGPSCADPLDWNTQERTVGLLAPPSNARRRKPYKRKKCQFCDATFIKNFDYNDHLKLHSGNDPQECIYCHESFSDNTHTRCKTSLRQRTIPCNVCGRLFSHNRLLVLHMRVHTGEKTTSQCNICSKVFSRKSSLQAHLRTHTGDRRYACLNCDKRFYKKDHLNTHVLSVHLKDHDNYECDTCGKAYKTKTAIRRHCMTHTNKQVSRCGVCLKTFYEKQAYINHVKLHDKAYLCPMCGKKFGLPASLKIHMVVHTGEKKFLCPMCGKCFSTQTTLKIHSRIHSGELPYECPMCDLRVSQRSNLNRHMRRKHSGGNLLATTE